MISFSKLLELFSLEKIDFIERDWINNSGWPISYNEVSAYYPKVDSFLQLYHKKIGFGCKLGLAVVMW